MEQTIHDVLHITPKARFIERKGVEVTFLINEDSNTLQLGTVLLEGKHSRALTVDEMKEAWDKFIKYILDPAVLPQPYNEVFAVYKYSTYNTWHCTLTKADNPWSIRLEQRPNL